MATRTSSPPGSRGKNTSARKSGQGGSSSRSHTSGNKTGRKPAQKSSQSSKARKRGSAARRPPRAVRNGPGPVSLFFSAIGRVLATAWLVLAHAIGSGVRRIGHTASELDPAPRRDGAGLVLVGGALVVAAAGLSPPPRGVGECARCAAAGSVGRLAWLVPLLLCTGAWRTLRAPEANGPAGRQVSGWTALLFGVHGFVHIANGSPT